jgi:hypothetical protein
LAYVPEFEFLASVKKALLVDLQVTLGLDHNLNGLGGGQSSLLEEKRGWRL